jgi:hypothetical protein
MLVLGLWMATLLSAETAKSKEASLKPQTSVAKIKEESIKAMPAGASVKYGSSDPALCLQPNEAAKSKANAAEPGDDTSPPLSVPTTASSSELDAGAQSSPDRPSSEIITDKLKLSLEPKTDTASEPAAQCGHEENRTQAGDKADSPQN